MAEVRVKSAFVNKTIGSPVFKLNVAESHSKKNEQGGWDTTSRTHFDLIASRDSGVDLGSFSEGDRIAFQGTQFTDVREYQGKKYYTLTVWVDRIELLDRRGQQGQVQQGGYGQQSQGFDQVQGNQAQGGYGQQDYGQQSQQPVQDAGWSVPGADSTPQTAAPSQDGFDDDIEAPF